MCRRDCLALCFRGGCDSSGNRLRATHRPELSFAAQSRASGRLAKAWEGNINVYLIPPIITINIPALDSLVKYLENIPQAQAEIDAATKALTQVGSDLDQSIK